MAPKLPPPEALSHVIYEMWMMAECIVRLTPPNKLIGFEKNLHLEGFVVHARCLDEFFKAQSTKAASNDNIRPDYFGYDNCNGLYAKRVTFQRMHKEIAHISHSRKSNPADKKWFLGAELVKIAPVCIDFLKFVAKDSVLMAFKNNKAGNQKTLKMIEILLARARQGGA